MRGASLSHARRFAAGSSRGMPRLYTATSRDGQCSLADCSHLALPGWLLMAGGWAHRFLLDAQASMPPDTEPRRSCNCKASFPSTDTRRRVRGHNTRARGLKQPFPSTDTRRRVRGHQTRLAPSPIQDQRPQAGRCLLRRPHRVRVKTQTSFMVLERDGLVPLFTLATKTY